MRVFLFFFIFFIFLSTCLQSLCLTFYTQTLSGKNCQDLRNNFTTQSLKNQTALKIKGSSHTRRYFHLNRLR